MQQITLDQRCAELRLQPLAPQLFPARGLRYQHRLIIGQKVSRQPLGVAGVTPRLRDTVFRSSPRRSRSTAAVLRCRDIRPPRPSAAVPASRARSASPGRASTWFVVRLWLTSRAEIVRLRGVPINCAAGLWRAQGWVIKVQRSPAILTMLSHFEPHTGDQTDLKSSGNATAGI